MSDDNTPTPLNYVKTLKVMTTSHRQMKKGKEYVNLARRIYIPNRFYNLISKEIQNYNQVEVTFDPATLRLIYTFKTPPQTSENV